MISARDLVEQSNAVFNEACLVFDQAAAPGLTKAQVLALLERHDALVAKHRVIAAQYSRLLQPEASIH